MSTNKVEDIGEDDDDVSQAQLPEGKHYSWGVTYESTICTTKFFFTHL